MAQKVTFKFNTSNIFIPAQQTITDETGRRVKIRYVEGEDTLNPKEQSEDAVARRIHVPFNLLTTSNPVLIEFLKKSDRFSKTKNNHPFSYYIEDREKESSDFNKTKELILDANIIVRQTTGVALISSAYLLLGQMVFKLTEGEIKSKLYKIADITPQKVLDAFDDKTSKFQIFTAQAIYKKVIEMPIGATTINWYDGHEIFSVQKGQNVLEEFAKHLSTKEGLGLQQEIAIKLKNKEPKPKSDNLTELTGVGNSSALILESAGYNTFFSLANATVEEIKKTALNKGVELPKILQLETIIESAKEKING